MSNELTKTKSNELKTIISTKSMQDLIKSSLKENAGSFTASLLELYGGDNYLQKCEPKAVAMEALKAASLKLPLNKNLGFAYIIPRNRSLQVNGKWEKILEPHFQIGYKGFIQLAMRTGQYKYINADVITEGMVARKDYLTGMTTFTGEPIENGKVIGYFAYFKLLNGFEKVVFWESEKMNAHAMKYVPALKQGKSTPWKTDPIAMGLKTVLSNLLRTYGIMSTEMMSAISEDLEGSETNFNEDQEEKIKNVIDEKQSKVDYESGEVIEEETKEKKEEIELPGAFN